MRFLECLKSAGTILHGNNYLWSMMQSSASRMQRFYVFSDSVFCLGKDRRQKMREKHHVPTFEHHILISTLSEGVPRTDDRILLVSSVFCSRHAWGPARGLGCLLGRTKDKSRDARASPQQGRGSIHNRNLRSHKTRHKDFLHVASAPQPRAASYSSHKRSMPTTCSRSPRSALNEAPVRRFLPQPAAWERQQSSPWCMAAPLLIDVSHDVRHGIINKNVLHVG